MGFFGFVFWMAMLWIAFRVWQRWEGRRMVRSRYGPYNGWYDSGEFYDRKPRKIERKRQEGLQDQQAYIESLEIRVTELEERLDFTERLLAERQEISSGR